MYTIKQQVDYGVDQDGYFIGYDKSIDNVINFRNSYLLRECIHIWLNGNDTPRMHIHGLHPNFSYKKDEEDEDDEDNEDGEYLDDSYNYLNSTHAGPTSKVPTT